MQMDAGLHTSTMARVLVLGKSAGETPYQLLLDVLQSS